MSSSKGTISLGGVGSVTPRSAGRASHACDRCRQKKQKCEVLGNGTCQLCIAVRMECEWTHTDKRGSQATRIAELEGTIQALRDEINSLKQQQGDAAVATQHNLAATQHNLAAVENRLGTVENRLAVVENTLAVVVQSFLDFNINVWPQAVYPPADGS